MNNSFKKLLFLILYLAPASAVYSQTTFTSVTTGDWDDGATWGNTSPGVQGTDWPAITDNIVVAAEHTVTMTNAETINNFTINFGGEFDFGGFVLTANGAVSPFISQLTGDYSTNGTWLNGSVPTSTNDIVITKGTAVTFSAAVTMNDLSINSGAVLDDDNKGNNTFTGNLLLNGTFLGQKELHLAGSGVTIDGKGVYNNTKKLKVFGNVSILASADLSFFSEIEIQNDIVVTNNGFLTTSKKVKGKNAESTWINAAGSYLTTSDKIFDDGKGVLDASVSPNTVEYYSDGGGDQKIAAFVYDNLVLSGSKKKKLKGDITVNGDVNIDGGALDTDAANNYSITIGGNWTNNSSLTANNSTVTFNGTGAQTINGSSTTTFNNLTINNTSGGVTLNAPATISSTGSLTMTSGIVTTDATNILTVNSGGASSKGTSSSFVDGPIKKIGNTDFGFPSGNSSVWAPLDVATIVGGNAATEFTTQYHFSAAPNPGDLPVSGLDHVSGLEYWEVTNTGTAVTSADLSLHWQDADRSEITDLTTGAVQDLVAVHYNSGTPEWEVLVSTIDGASMVGSGGMGFITATFTSFSPVSFGSVFSLNALPVELVYFHGKLLPKGVVLKWQTASELNNDFFEIEVSGDGENFTIIATISGQGTTTVVTNYEFTDQYPTNGLNYYRLRQLDFNGEFIYSNIISVMNDAPAKLYFSAYPQPASSHLTLQLMAIDVSSPMYLTIYDLIGNFLEQLKVDPKTKHLLLDISAFTNGLYLVRLNQAEQVYHCRLLIQK